MRGQRDAMSLAQTLEPYFHSSNPEHRICATLSNLLIYLIPVSSSIRWTNNNIYVIRFPWTLGELVCVNCLERY